MPSEHIEQLYAAEVEERRRKQAAHEERVRQAAALTEAGIASRYGTATGQVVGLGAQLGDMRGAYAGVGVAQMLRAPGKMFARSDILAIIRAQHGIASTFEAKEALDALARIFERME